MSEHIDWEQVAAQQTSSLIAERVHSKAMADAVNAGDHTTLHHLCSRTARRERHLTIQRHYNHCQACGKPGREDYETVQSLRDNLGIMAERVAKGKEELEDVAASRQGRRAFFNGVPLQHCPYTDQHRGMCWRSGWVEARRESILVRVTEAAKSYLKLHQEGSHMGDRLDAFKELQASTEALLEHDTYL